MHRGRTLTRHSVISREIKKDVAKGLVNDKSILDNQAAIKDDTLEILQELARVKALLRDQEATLLPGKKDANSAIARYLDDLTSYAETVCWSGRDSDTDDGQEEVKSAPSKRPESLAHKKVHKKPATPGFSQNVSASPSVNSPVYHRPTLNGLDSAPPPLRPAAEQVFELEAKPIPRPSTASPELVPNFTTPLNDSNTVHQLSTDDAKNEGWGWTFSSFWGGTKDTKKSENAEADPFSEPLSVLEPHHRTARSPGGSVGPHHPTLEQISNKASEVRFRKVDGQSRQLLHDARDLEQRQGPYHIPNGVAFVSEARVGKIDGQSKQLSHDAHEAEQGQRPTNTFSMVQRLSTAKSKEERSPVGKRAGYSMSGRDIREAKLHAWNFDQDHSAGNPSMAAESSNTRPSLPMLDCCRNSPSTNPAIWSYHSQLKHVSKRTLTLQCHTETKEIVSFELRGHYDCAQLTRF